MEWTGWLAFLLGLWIGALVMAVMISLCFTAKENKQEVESNND